ncbi:MAG: tetratricopeptide repeat protein [Myxococcota bacterium]
MTREVQPFRRASSWFALGLAFTLHAASARAEEAGSNEASAVAVSEQRAAEAFQAYSKKDYAGAVALYLQAYEASPNGSILYNVARIYDTKLGDRPLAITFYRRYIADPGAYVEKIEFANQRLKELREAEIATAKLNEAEPAARTTPTSVEPTRGQVRPSPREPQQPVTHEDAGWSTLRWTGAVLGAIGVVGLGTGAIFGLSAMSKANTAKEICDGNACASQQGVDAAHSANDAATLANVGLIAGGGLLLTGATLFILGGQDSTEKSRASALRWDARTGRSSLALEVSGTW